MNIDILNAHCGFGSLPEPRLSEGRQTVIAHYGLFASGALKRRSPGALGVSRAAMLPSISRFGQWHAAFLALYRCGPGASPSRGGPRPLLIRALERGGDVARFVSRTPPTVAAWFERDSALPSGSQLRRLEGCACRMPMELRFIDLRPRIRRDYPLNLSISVSGGKETNKDSPSNGE